MRMHIIMFVSMCICMFLYCVCANYATYLNNVHRVTQPIGPLYDTYVTHIGRIDRMNHHILYTVANILPWIGIGIYAVLQVIGLCQNRLDIVPYTFFVEGLSMAINGILHCITILPDAYRDASGCSVPGQHNNPPNVGPEVSRTSHQLCCCYIEWHVCNIPRIQSRIHLFPV